MGKGKQGGGIGGWEEARKGGRKAGSWGTQERVRGRVRSAGHTMSSMCAQELVGPVCLLCTVCVLKGLSVRKGVRVGNGTGVTVPVGKHRVACADNAWSSCMVGCVSLAQ